jgi:hypothetical protein
MKRAYSVYLLYGLTHCLNFENTSVIRWHAYLKHSQISVISGFRREVDENCALLGYYAASSGNFLLTFRDNLLVPPSGVKIYSQISFLHYVCILRTSRTLNDTNCALFIFIQ